MLDLNLFNARKGPLEILCLGAHCDDIEIGCGGALLKLLAARKDVGVTWVVFCSTPAREKEARRSAAAFLKGAKRQRILIHGFRDGFLPNQGEGPKEAFEALKQQPDPDFIFTHFRQDLHQDHRLVGDLTWNTFRNHVILEYEIPKWDGDLGAPNAFIPLAAAHAKKKVSLLMKHYGTQRSKDWFAPDIFLSLQRLRGMETRAPSGYAEAFYCRKLSL